MFLCFFIFLSFHIKLSQTRVYPASGKGGGGSSGTIFGVLVEKVGGESGEGGKGVAGMRVGSCFARFRMTRARWNGQLKTMGDLSKIKPIWRCHDHIRQAAAR